MSKTDAFLKILLDVHETWYTCWKVTTISNALLSIYWFIFYVGFIFNTYWKHAVFGNCSIQIELKDNEDYLNNISSVIAYQAMLYHVCRFRK